ncbi:uncharacterized protein EV154DRAFT_492417 [Mucor mucedo]|uniref:uncharacterized protein n=1 Tax=Mucor mucedo TaxID=29922 RepID=UPI00221F96DF|nr:uncharacterized protein EV154DRAFT_492417 [Mucor mucedo]KAI7896476.1 hypothetical protein EV154DRAFT_492417 [Mucor mucedo]
MQAKVKSIDLQTMKLRTKFLCQEVFVSIDTSANDPINSRDYDMPNLCSDQVKCSGNTQDMIKFLATTSQKVRLVAIDFAGMSTNVDDLRCFIKSSKAIKELVVDEGHKITVFTRHELLHNDDIINKFNCRRGLVKRSRNA